MCFCLEEYTCDIITPVSELLDYRGFPVTQCWTLCRNLTLLHARYKITVIAVACPLSLLHKYITSKRGSRWPLPYTHICLCPLLVALDFNRSSSSSKISTFHIYTWHFKSWLMYSIYLRLWVLWRHFIYYSNCVLISVWY